MKKYYKIINFYLLSICTISGLFGTSYIIYKFPCSPYEWTTERVKLYQKHLNSSPSRQTVEQKRNRSVSHLFLLSVWGVSPRLPLDTLWASPLLVHVQLQPPAAGSPPGSGLPLLAPMLPVSPAPAPAPQQHSMSTVTQFDLLGFDFVVLSNLVNTKLLLSARINKLEKKNCKWFIFVLRDLNSSYSC